MITKTFTEKTEEDAIRKALNEKANIERNGGIKFLAKSDKTIISLENGKYNASLQLAYKIAKYFNVTIEEIYDMDGNSLDAARHPKQKVKFKCDVKLNPYDLLRLI